MEHNQSKWSPEAQLAAIQRIHSECEGLFRTNLPNRSYSPPQTSHTKFVLLTRARSGSTFLAALLDGHPDIKSFEEALHPEGLLVKIPGFQTIAERDSDRPKFLDALYSFQGAAAVGFKGVLRLEVDRPALCRRKHVRTPARICTLAQMHIVLRRNNLLDVYISECKAKVVKSYMFVNTSKVKVRVPTKEFFKYAHNSERHYRCISAAKAASRLQDPTASNWQYVNYESHLIPSAIEGTLTRLFKHLNVALYETNSSGSSKETYAQAVLKGNLSFVKQDTASHSKSIINFPEVTAALRGTRYESMIRNDR
eukprot:6183744-Pleurochrysis_carterae.AAC.2